MKISYFAFLRDMTRKAEEEWKAPAPTMRHLMHDLVAAYGTEFARWVMTEGKLSGLAIILVDGHDIRSLQGMDTPLTQDSHVFIFPPLAGG